MYEYRLSVRQRRTLGFLALTALATETTPALVQGAGGAGWLAPLLAALPVLLATGLAWRCRGEDLGEQLARLVGKRAARWLLLPFLLWGLVLVADHSVRTGGRLAEGLPLPPVLLTGLVLALSAWMAGGKPAAFGRACGIFVLALAAGLVLIFVLAMFQLQWEFVLLPTKRELVQLPGAAVRILGLWGVGSYLLFLKTAPEKEDRGPGIWGKSGWFLLLSGSLLLILGRFGGGLTLQLERPFFQMVSGLSAEGAFQRLEGLVSALWLLGDLSLLGLLLLAGRRILAQIIAREETAPLAWILAAAAFLLGVGNPGGGEDFPLWQGSLWVGILAMVVLGLAHWRGQIKNSKKVRK